MRFYDDSIFKKIPSLNSVPIYLRNYYIRHYFDYFIDFFDYPLLLNYNYRLTWLDNLKWVKDYCFELYQSYFPPNELENKTRRLITLKKCHSLELIHYVCLLGFLYRFNELDDALLIAQLQKSDVDSKILFTCLCLAQRTDLADKMGLSFTDYFHKKEAFRLFFYEMVCVGNKVVCERLLNSLLPTEALALLETYDFDNSNNRYYSYAYLNWDNDQDMLFWLCAQNQKKFIEMVNYYSRSYIPSGLLNYVVFLLEKIPDSNELIKNSHQPALNHKEFINYIQCVTLYISNDPSARLDIIKPKIKILLEIPEMLRAIQSRLKADQRFLTNILDNAFATENYSIISLLSHYSSYCDFPRAYFEHDYNQNIKKLPQLLMALPEHTHVNLQNTGIDKSRDYFLSLLQQLEQVILAKNITIDISRNNISNAFLAKGPLINMMHHHSHGFDAHIIAHIAAYIEPSNAYCFFFKPKQGRNLLDNNYKSSTAKNINSSAGY